MENTYEEVVLQTVMKDILQGERGGRGGPEEAQVALAKGHRETQESERRLGWTTGFCVSASLPGPWLC